MIHIILLSGGSGSRLWPLSNEARSKQFLKVLRNSQGDHVSMVQRVFEQLSQTPIDLDITIATSASQQNSLERQIDGNYSLVVEPERRDTAPAIMLACSHLILEQQASPSDTVIVMPIDTYADQSFYDTIDDLNASVQSDCSDLILLGVKPSFPSEKYGYIVPASSDTTPFPVSRFTEKPAASEARKLIEQGALWNCGVFAFRLSYLKKIVESYTACTSFSDIVNSYRNLPKNSFDYEIVEKANSISVLPYSGKWKDLGTWNTLTEEMADETAGRVVVDSSTCRNVHVVNEIGLPLAVAGVNDSVIVATPDGILVSGKKESANIKPLVQAAAETRPMYEKRRWGEYRVIDSNVYNDGMKSLTKELIIEKGKQLSYQKHAHRSEVWTIVSGTGKVVLGEKVIEVSPGSVIDIEPGQLHAGFGSTELHIIEVQLGDMLIEEDIERFGYFWKDQYNAK